AKKAINEMAKYSQKWHDEASTRKKGTETSNGLAAMQAQLNNLGREIKKVNEKAATDSAIRNQRALIKALEIQIRQMSKVLQERASGNLHSLTETNPRDHVKSISTNVDADCLSIRCIKFPQYGVSTHQNNNEVFLKQQMAVPFSSCLTDYCWSNEEESKELHNFHVYSYESLILKDDLPRKEKDLGSFTLPCFINNTSFNKALADLGASINMPEDIKTPLILRRPFLSTAHAKIDVFKRKIAIRVGNDKVVFQSDKPIRNIIRRVYALSLEERMELDLEARLMGESLMINRFQDPDFGDFIELNDLNEPLELSFYNSIMKDKLEFKGKNVVGAFINVPFFVGTFSVITDFAVMENMDAYRDKEIGGVIVGKEFCKEIGIKAK
ncbi:hypothetical protein Tco_1490159, partial [Tanacetum coccineum]